MESSITYLDRILNTNKKNFPNMNVNICIYSIYDKTEPYVLYLLHNLNNKLYWPHFESKSDGINEYSLYLKQMGIVKYEYQGYLVKDNELYIYIKLENNFRYDKLYIKNINWFVSINEILFPRMSWIYNIDSSVTSIFIKYPLLIYLYKKDNRLDIPEVAYYTTSLDNKQYNTYIGLENNTNEGITVYNYDAYPPGYYSRIILFLYKYIVPDINVDSKIIKRREIDVDKDNYEILSSHGI